MKILWIDLVSEMGGAQYSFLDICKTLSKMTDMEIVAAVPKGPLFDRLAAAGITVYPVSPLRASRHGWGLFVTAAKLLAAPSTFSQIIHVVKPDIVHANGLSAFLAVGHAAKNIPVFWHVRDLRQSITIMREAAKSATRIIAASQAIEEFLAENLSPQVVARIKTIDNGIDVARFQTNGQEEARKRFGLPPSVPIIGMIAHFIPWKRHKAFIAAAGLIHKSVPDAHFVIVGRDLFHEAVRYIKSLREQIAAAGLEPFMHIYTECTAVEEILPAFSLLLHPAIGEPFGRVLCEAMACGKPVVAVSAGGPEEIVEPEKTGILCKEGTPEEFCEAVLRLLADPSLSQRFAAEGLRVVREKYTIQRVAAQLSEVYHSTLDSLTSDAKRGSYDD